MNELQKAVRQFQQEHGMRLPAELAALDLGAEVGELMKEVLLATDYGKRPPQPGPNLEAELGDALYSLIGLAEASGLDVERALMQRLLAMRERFAHRRR